MIYLFKHGGFHSYVMIVSGYTFCKRCHINSGIWWLIRKNTGLLGERPKTTGWSSLSKWKHCHGNRGLPWQTHLFDIQPWLPWLYGTDRIQPCPGDAMKMDEYVVCLLIVFFLWWTNWCTFINRESLGRFQHYIIYFGGCFDSCPNGLNQWNILGAEGSLEFRWITKEKNISSS